MFFISICVYTGDSYKLICVLLYVNHMDLKRREAKHEAVICAILWKQNI